MGYHTDFNGEFDLDKPLSPEHKTYLEQFSYTRRVQRKQSVASKMEDPVRLAAGLPIGKEGAYFVGAKGHCGQDIDDSVKNYNTPPQGQPSLWCQWIPNTDGTAIQWDGGEKFYEYVDWIEYLINNFLKPWGYVLNGEVEWFGEDRHDRGLIVVDNNIVTTKTAVVYYE
jgi:hypothetical protein